MKGMLKWPLILAAAVVILRIVLEQAGAPGGVTNLLSVVMLYLLICPIYFALRIANSGMSHPYRTLIKNTALYATLARAMVVPTYWLAYIYQWTAPRFSRAQGGVVGEGITPISAYLLIPLSAMLLWIIASVIIGGGVGSAIIAFKRKSQRAPAL
jgi:hypothetical protein